MGNFPEELSGTIPEGLCSLTSLMHLLLVNNQLNGMIPEFLSSLMSLKVLGGVIGKNSDDEPYATHTHTHTHTPTTLIRI